MHYRRCYVSVCVFNDKIYAIGGHDGHNRLRTAEVYDPETNQWTLLASMTNRRSDADCCVVNDNIYVVGLCEICSVIFLKNFLKKVH